MIKDMYPRIALLRWVHVFDHVVGVLDQKAQNIFVNLVEFGQIQTRFTGFMRS